MRRASDKLDPDKIQAGLKTNRIGKSILVYESTTSTNDIASEYAKNKKNDGLVILAEQQTAGRGRAGSKWITGKTDSILCSIILTEVTFSPDLLSLVSAVAVAEILTKTTGQSAQIKWPNDILLNGKKAAGILLESKQYKDFIFYILGIGINCHQKTNDFTHEIRRIATSVDLEKTSTCNRILLIQELLSSLEQCLKTAASDSRKIINQWQQHSILYHHRVKLVYNSQKFEGHCMGIDPQKGLILKLDSGGTRFFDAAHTSIIK